MTEVFLEIKPDKTIILWTVKSSHDGDWEFMTKDFSADGQTN